MRSQDFEGGAFERGNTLLLEMKDVGGGEGQGNRDQRLRQKDLRDVVAVRTNLGQRTAELRMGECNLGWISRLQNVAAVKGIRGKVGIRLGRDEGPRMEELCCPDTVAKAVVYCSAEDHTATAKMSHLTTSIDKPVSDIDIVAATPSSCLAPTAKMLIEYCDFETKIHEPTN